MRSRGKKPKGWYLQINATRMLKGKKKLTLGDLANIAQIGASIVAVIGGGAAATLYINSQTQQLIAAKDTEYSRVWASFPEGCMGCNFSDIPKYNLYLEWSNGKMNGYGDFANYSPADKVNLSLNEPFEVSYKKMLILHLGSVLMDGERFVDDINITMYEFVWGKKVTIGHAVIRKVGDDYTWEILDIDPPYDKILPKRSWITPWEKLPKTLDENSPTGEVVGGSVEKNKEQGIH
jgi:hypothetical protein